MEIENRREAEQCARLSQIIYSIAVVVNLPLQRFSYSLCCFDHVAQGGSGFR
jgi:hypothetical protein